MIETCSPVNYLLNHRLRWGQPDTLSLLKSDVRNNLKNSTAEPHESVSHPDITMPISFMIPPYFSWETPPQFISIIQNDWPYSGNIFTILSKTVISLSGNLHWDHFQFLPK